LILGGDLTANFLLAVFVASVNADLAPWFGLECGDVRKHAVVQCPDKKGI
jgi:hypothetical protein